MRVASRDYGAKEVSGVSENADDIRHASQKRSGAPATAGPGLSQPIVTAVAYGCDPEGEKCAQHVVQLYRQVQNAIFAARCEAAPKECFMQRKVALLVTLLLCLSAIPLLGQTVTGTLEGRVVDR